MKIESLIIAGALGGAILFGGNMLGDRGAAALAGPQVEDPAPDDPEGDVPRAPRDGRGGQRWRDRGGCPFGHECRQGSGFRYGGRDGRHREGGHMERWRGRSGPGGGLAAQGLLRHARALDLSPEQVKKLEDMADETHKNLIGLRADLEKERISMRSELRSGRDDMNRLKRHLSAIASKKAEIQEMRLTHFLEVKRVLTDEQRQRLQSEFPRLGRWAH